MSERRAAREEETSKPRGLLYFVGVGLSAGLLAFVVLIGVLVIVVPAATGSTPMTVLTGSMQPTYPPGTLIIVKPLDANEVRIGDPITYQIESGKDAVVTHRVVAINNTTSGDVSFLTKGDANGAVDALPVQPVQLKGKVWYSIPWIGYLNNLIGGGERGWLVTALAIGLFLYAGYMVASGITGSARKRRRAREREKERQQAKADDVLGRTPTSAAGHDGLDPQYSADPLNRAAPVYRADQL